MPKDRVKRMMKKAAAPKPLYGPRDRIRERTNRAVRNSMVITDRGMKRIMDANEEDFKKEYKRSPSVGALVKKKERERRLKTYENLMNRKNKKR